MDLKWLSMTKSISILFIDPNTDQVLNTLRKIFQREEIIWI